MAQNHISIVNDLNFNIIQQFLANPEFSIIKQKLLNVTHEGIQEDSIFKVIVMITFSSPVNNFLFTA